MGDNMSIAFVVEDGTGLANATSYVSIAEADDFFSVDLFENTAWAALNTTQKQNLLIKATRLMDAYYDYSGNKVFENASLRWPRSGVVDLDGNSVSQSIVPVAVKNATCELAYSLTTDNLAEEPDDRGLSSIEVSSIKIVFDKSDKKGYVPIKSKNWMRGYGRLMAGSKVVKLILA